MKFFYANSKKLKLVIFFIVLTSIVLNSCKKEKLNTDQSINVVNKTIPDKSIIETIDFKTFLSSIKSIKSAKLNLLLNKIPDQENSIKLSSIDTYEGLTLFTDSIRKINHEGHTTYTFPVKQINPTYITFQNFVVDVKHDEITTFLISYTPDSTFLINLYKNKPGLFSGKVKAEIFNSESSTGLQVQTIKPHLAMTTCTTLIIYDNSYTLCQGQDGIKHSYDQGYACSGFGTSQGAQKYEVAIPVTTCETVNLPGGGGGGGGGGDDPYTPPVTPPNYNPCPPLVNVSSIDRKINLLPGGGGGCPIVTPPTIPTWPTNLIINVPPADKIIPNIVDYLKCFNKSAAAVINIYVDQPTANSSDTWSGTPIDPNVGHTFISIEQNGITRVLGFYPAVGVNPLSSTPTAPGTLVNDSGHPYDVKVTINPVTATQLTNVISYITNYPSTYNLNTYNCTDFGLNVIAKAGLILPDHSGSWPGGSGSNPGNLGQDIRSMTDLSNITIKKTSGNAVSNTGVCN